MNIAPIIKNSTIIIINIESKDVYKDYAKAYEKFIKKNPGYEDKISGKIS